jgi:predicted AlkP superfamily phosphohydrolase/phosphomutase
VQAVVVSFRRAIVFLLMCAAAGALISCRRAQGHWKGDHKLIILGIDGMDPDLLRRYMAEGAMPNFSKLAAKGTFRTLATSIPPQSPVAWSNMITGMNAGGHGLFDFIHRDPKTMQPYYSASRVEPAQHSIHIGSWTIPLGSGKAEQLRQGKAFWEYLDERGVPVTVYRIPSNFPPIASKGRTLAGMGTPDLRGTYGTFSYFTDDPMAQTGEVEGGQIVPVMVENWRVKSALLGPDNSFRRGSPAVQIPFTVSLDPVEAVAKVAIQDHEFVLREGEWSDWIRLDFTLLPVVANVKGICRMYLKQAHPRFELYVSPVNIDPAEPALPLSTPSSYSRELSEKIGEYYTQGIAEDTKALSDGVLDDKEYLEQSREVMAEQRRVFDTEFPKFHSGLFFFYFSGIDLNSHMLWRQIDPRHPGYDAQAAAQYGNALPKFYQQMDQVLGEILARMDEHTTLLVMSDHGFAPYYRSFNLNTWLLDNGYLRLKPGADQEQGEYFAYVDWSKTRAYGLGLNGLYVNLKGRERDGIVAPGESDKLLAEITSRLLAVRDPKNGAQVITRMDRASDAYNGPYARSGPDLIVGYNRGYRAGWRTILGAFPREVIENNMNPWSGDHCMDYTLVPGILLSNRAIAAPAASLTDIAPTILAEFGIAKGRSMIGKPLFSPENITETHSGQ